MEPNVNPLAPDSSEPTERPSAASPYSPSEPGATRPQFGNSTFKSRTIQPIEPTVSPQSAQPTSLTDPTAAPGIVQQPMVIEPAMPTAPAAQPFPYQAAPAAFVGADITAATTDKVFIPSMPVNGQVPRKKFNFRSKPFMAGIGVFVLLTGFAAYYFGYKTNPNVIFSQAMSNSSKGYDKLIEYVDAQSKVSTKATTGTGSFNLKSGGTSTDGNIAFKSDDKNGELNFDVGVAGTRVSFEGRSIETSSGSPDLYLKASGIKGLGGILGAPQLDAPLSSLDDSWIVIDHTLLDSLTAGSGSSTKDMLPPTSAQVLDAAKGFGKVNQEYLFSTDKDKAVMVITKKHGLESVDGHNTYHYTVALQKDNVKAYIDAQKAALKASKLNSWLKANGIDETFDSAFDGLKGSADSIKSSDTFDMWADVDQRLIYKVRYSGKSNPANNYVDVGLDYQGGDEFPFFIAGQTKDESGKTSSKAVMSLNTKTQETKFSVDVKTSGYFEATFGMKMAFKPSDQAVKVQKPANAKPLAEVLNQLGYGDVLDQLKSSASSNNAGGGVQAKARNSKRSSDMRSLQTNIEAFYAQNGYYPSQSDVNNSRWLTTNMKSFDQNALIDPSNTGQSKKLVTTPAANVYSYAPTDASGRSCEADDTQCQKYKLVATFEGNVNGVATFTVTNLDGS